MPKPKRPKIAVAGGGIAGMYCALELASKGNEVTLFEALPRCGGRIETLDDSRDGFEGFKAECGPMRFELATQPRFKALADRLDVRFQKFAAPQAEQARFPAYDLLGDEFSKRQRETIEDVRNSGGVCEDAIFSHYTSALDLLRLGIYRIFQGNVGRPAPTLQDVVHPVEHSQIGAYADSLGDYEYEHIRTRALLDGVALYKLGFWNALSRVLSSAAIQKIRDIGTFYHLLPENPSASEWAIFWLRLFRSDAGLSTITEEKGVSTVIDRLKEAMVRQGVTVRQRAQVVAVRPSRSPSKVRLSYRLETSQTKELDSADFDHVILALPARPLHNLVYGSERQWFFERGGTERRDLFPPDVKEVINSVIPFPLTKVFVVFRDPWWKVQPDPQTGAHILPTREIHYSEANVRGEHRGMLMFYTDRPATSYWNLYITDNPHQAAQLRHPLELKHELARHLSHLKFGEKANQSQINETKDRILTFAIRDWSRMPFGAACHAWQAGIKVPEAMDYLDGFNLAGQSGPANVHICGEAYSDYQGFIEGALRSAHRVLVSIDSSR